MSAGGAARRSCLSVPGGDERKLAKVAGCGADEVVLDLEDAVPVVGKDAARETVAAFLAAPPNGVPRWTYPRDRRLDSHCHRCGTGPISSSTHAGPNSVMTGTLPRAGSCRRCRSAGE